MNPFRRKPKLRNAIEECSPRVYRQLKRMFGPNADIDDMAQEVFLEVVRGWSRFEGRSKVTTWVHRITLNVVYKEMRLRYRRPQLAGGADPDTLDGKNDSADASTQMQLRSLYHALEQLHPDLRMVLLLRDIEEHTLAEISEITGKPLQTIASQSKRAREQLAQAMNPQPTPNADRDQGERTS